MEPVKYLASMGERKELKTMSAPLLVISGCQIGSEGAERTGRRAETATGGRQT